MIAVGELRSILQRVWQLGYRVAARGVLGSGFDVPFHAAAIYAQERAGWLVDEVDGVTRERIRAVIADVLGPAFDSPAVPAQDLASRLLEEFEGMADWRASTIARTETAYATSFGAAAAWGDGGITHVEIADGDTYDAACAAADGAVWTIEQYLANPLEHPNCSRAAYPIVPVPMEAVPA